MASGPGEVDMDGCTSFTRHTFFIFGAVGGFLDLIGCGFAHSLGLAVGGFFFSKQYEIVRIMTIEVTPRYECFGD